MKIRFPEIERIAFVSASLLTTVLLTAPTVPARGQSADETHSTPTEIVVAQLTDVRLSVKADETDDVNWVTSCGTMHDFDLPAAYLRVEKEDPTEGDLGVIRRTELGGVAWRIWPIRSE